MHCNEKSPRLIRSHADKVKRTYLTVAVSAALCLLTATRFCRQ